MTDRQNVNDDPTEDESGPEALALTLVKWNKRTRAGTADVVEEAWVHPEFGELITLEYYNSVYWRGLAFFKDFTHPGPGWIKVTRPVHTETGLWTTVEG